MARFPLVRWPGHVTRPAMLLALLIAAASSVHAHELGEGALPEGPGLRIDVSAVAAYAHAAQPLPAPQLAGTLGLGDTPRDQRGWRLEHGTLGAGLRLSPELGAQLALGWHDSDPAHVEAAWLQARSRADSDLTLGLGRGRLPMGTVLVRAGHFDRYGAMPLVKRAAFNGDWIEDGVNLAWRPHFHGSAAWLQAVDLGLWRARKFPGSDAAPWAPALHVGAAWSQVQADFFLSRVQPRGRGAYVQRANSGHIHDAPQCEQSLREISCFDGTVDLLAASANWDTPWPGLALSAAAVWRRERGSLYSQNGDTQYRSQSTGGWLELLWQPSAQWDLGMRQEWLRTNNRLAGPGAALVARDASLLPNHPARRFTAMLGWRPGPAWLLALEAGHERIAGKGQAVAGVRLVWTPQALVDKRW